ncbi:hypothetical protein STEG23_021892, partial [Scotinomys teguina]
MMESGVEGDPVHKALLTKVTSGSSISSEHTHVTPINIVNAKENIPGFPTRVTPSTISSHSNGSPLFGVAGDHSHYYHSHYYHSRYYHSRYYHSRYYHSCYYHSRYWNQAAWTLTLQISKLKKHLFLIELPQPIFHDIIIKYSTKV